MSDRLIAEYDDVGTRFLYYTRDQINSTRVVTDGAGTGKGHDAESQLVSLLP
jgi:hypothetical protein